MSNTSINRSDLAYWLKRAEQEAISAIAAGHAAARSAHDELSRRYSALAVRALVRIGRAVA